MSIFNKLLAYFGLIQFDGLFGVQLQVFVIVCVPAPHRDEWACIIAQVVMLFNLLHLPVQHIPKAAPI